MITRSMAKKIREEEEKYIQWKLREQEAYENYLNQRETQRIERKEYKKYTDDEVEQMRQQVVDTYRRYIPDLFLYKLSIPFGQEEGSTKQSRRLLIIDYIQECLELNKRVYYRSERAVIIYGFFCIVSRVLGLLDDVKFATIIHRKIHSFLKYDRLDFNSFGRTHPDPLPTMKEVIGSLMNELVDYNNNELEEGN